MPGEHAVLKWRGTDLDVYEVIDTAAQVVHRRVDVIRPDADGLYPLGAHRPRLRSHRARHPTRDGDNTDTGRGVPRAPHGRRARPLARNRRHGQPVLACCLADAPSAAATAANPLCSMSSASAPPTAIACCAWPSTAGAANAYHHHRMTARRTPGTSRRAGYPARDLPVRPSEGDLTTSGNEAWIKSTPLTRKEPPPHDHHPAPADRTRRHRPHRRAASRRSDVDPRQARHLEGHRGEGRSRLLHRHPDPAEPARRQPGRQDRRRQRHRRVAAHRHPPRTDRRPTQAPTPTDRPNRRRRADSTDATPHQRHDADDRTTRTSTSGSANPADAPQAGDPSGEDTSAEPVPDTRSGSDDATPVLTGVDV